jgi:hypothetical protein
VLSVSVLAAALAVVGGVTVTTARDSRLAVLGLMVAAVASSFVASPLPSALAVAARILGATLAAYLLWTAANAAANAGSGSRLGPIAEACAAAAAFAMGLAVRPVDPLGGLPEAQAAGLALIVLSVAPLAGRDAIRVGMGVLLLTLGGSMLLAAWSGQPGMSEQPPDLQQLVMAVLLVGVAGATCLLVPAAARLEEERGDDPFRAIRTGRPSRQATPISSAAARMARDAGPATPQAARPARVAPAPPAPDGPAGRIPEPRPRPMTADPIEDDWLAWSSPEPERRREPDDRGDSR